ncbi:PREDICTED: isoflavone 2'-hydroxylase-like [Lupinus angustifolius]|nr:PREDICTED: isoflavone 2'-hydroxylase-like [Lupinus angustifolius]
MATLTLLHYSFFFLILLIIFKLFFKTKTFKNLPPGPPPLPIIGNLNILEKPLHRFFQTMSKKHGNIFSLWFGTRLAVIIQSPTAFQECFTKNDLVLANRPRNLSGKHIFYNYTTVGSCSYGEHWRNLRRIVATDVLSSQRILSFSGIRKDETQRLILKLAKDSSSNFAQVELTSTFRDMTYNNMMRMIAGKRYYGEESELKDIDEAKEFRETVTQLLQLAGVSNKADYLPFLKWFDFEGLNKKLMTTHKRFDTFVSALIKEQRSKEQREDSMIDHLLTLQESQPEYYTDQIIKGLTLAMLFAGTDSSGATLEWAFCNLLNHPKILKKAKDELDTQIGQDRLLNESDLSKLPYLKNIILETLRLYPPAPLLIPHVSSEDTTIGGFNIPKDTLVIVNAWGIQRDPKIWDEATSFKPERYEKEGEEKKLIAFGLGRRACPGEFMAMHGVSFTLGLLIQCFDWKRVSEEKIDMKEQTWFNLTKLLPLEAMCKSLPIINKALK